uniref:Uncharacterized protein n=1 Tax=Oryza meridionalis TaxID=40149 RepID=A0A0E0D5S6_9ORYZ
MIVAGTLTNKMAPALGKSVPSSSPRLLRFGVPVLRAGNLIGRCATAAAASTRDGSGDLIFR